MITKTKEYVREVGAEMSRVTWPSREEVRGSTIVVIIAVFLITIFIGLVDRGLSLLLGFVLGR
jgi:preprotein translocase subunit SecE